MGRVQPETTNRSHIFETMGGHDKILGVKLAGKHWRGWTRRRAEGTAAFGVKSAAWAGLAVLLCGFPAPVAAQTQSTTPAAPALPADASRLPDAPRAVAAVGEQQGDPQAAGSISGDVVDPSGAAVAGGGGPLTRGNVGAKKQ